jgi:hypothetical protein
VGLRALASLSARLWNPSTLWPFRSLLSRLPSAEHDPEQNRAPFRWLEMSAPQTAQAPVAEEDAEVLKREQPWTAWALAEPSRYRPGLSS